MKKALYGALFFGASYLVYQRVLGESMPLPQEMAHGVVSGSIYMLSYAAMRGLHLSHKFSMPAAALLTLVSGLGFEATQLTGLIPHLNSIDVMFDTAKDMGFNLAGLLIGIPIAYRIENN